MFSPGFCPVMLQDEMTLCFSMFLCCESCISGQRSSHFILHGPQQASADYFWDFFQHCHIPNFTNNLHIHYPVLQCSEKVPNQP